MAYQITSLDLFVREMPPDRMVFSIGGAPAKRRPRGILLARLKLTDGQGKTAWGVSGDRPSFGWLDKRPKYAAEAKLDRLLELVKKSREIYLQPGGFSSPFAYWKTCYETIHIEAKSSDHEPLTASFASALFERAMIDAVCRLHRLPILEALKKDRLSIDPGSILPQRKKHDLANHLPEQPLSRFYIRHTVGLDDPLSKNDVPDARRIRDGEPETLAEYIERDGLRFFKIKISGDRRRDLDRLAKIWPVILKAQQPVITLDGNESYRKVEEFVRFVHDLKEQQLGLYQHIAFIEQPLTRELTFDTSTQEAIRELAAKKPLVIDEADAELDSFQKALQIGYAGVSHKNCKGFFKSLLNFGLCHHWVKETGREAFQTGEDLSNMPIVPLQQDFAALGVLGIPHCERNGHHYGFGLKHLSENEKESALKQHGDLYTKRNGEVFLNIRNGFVRCESLRKTAFGTSFEPDWQTLTPLENWNVQW